MKKTDIIQMHRSLHKFAVEINERDDIEMQLSLPQYSKNVNIRPNAIPANKSDHTEAIQTLSSEMAEELSNADSASAESEIDKMLQEVA